MRGDYSQKNEVCVTEEMGEEECAKGEEVGITALSEILESFGMGTVRRGRLDWARVLRGRVVI